MSITVSTVANSQSFGVWLTRTNQIATIISSNTFTVDSSTTGSVTTGNGVCNGYIGINVLNVGNSIGGGTINAPNTLNIVTNTVFANTTNTFFSMTPLNIALTPSNSVSVNTSIWSVSVVNSSVTSNTYTVNTNLLTFNVSNTAFNSNNLVVTSNNLTVNAPTTFGNTVTLNANLTTNNTVLVGNSTVKVTLTPSSIAVANSTSNINITVPSTAAISNGSFYLNANGSYVSIASLVAAGGANTQVQFNSSGTMGASAAFTYNSTTGILTVSNTVSTNTVSTVNLGSNTGTITALTSNTANLVSVTSNSVTANNANLVAITANTIVANTTTIVAHTSNTINANTIAANSILAIATDASGTGGQYRLVGGTYATFFRNDGASMYFMQTASGNTTGTYNSFRPLSWNLSTGVVNIDGTGAGTNFGGLISSTNHILTTGYIYDANSVARIQITPNGTSTYVSAANGSSYQHGFNDHTNTIKWLMNYDGNFYTTGDLYASWSDERLKENIVSVNAVEGLHRVNSYRVVDFSWNTIGRSINGKEEGERQRGLIAQEVVPINPDAVHINETSKDENGNPYLTVSENKIIFDLIGAVQAQQKQIKELQDRIKILESK